MRILTVGLLLLLMVGVVSATSITINVTEDSTVDAMPGWSTLPVLSAAAGATTNFNRTATTSGIIIKPVESSQYNRMARGVLSVNLTNKTPAGSTINSGSLIVWGSSKDTSGYFVSTARLTNGTPNNPLTHIYTDYNKTVNVMMSGTNITRANWSVTSTNTYPLNAAALQYIRDNINGNVTFYIRSGMDINGVIEGTYSNYDGGSSLQYYTTNSANTTLWPTLVLDYTPPPPLPPVASFTKNTAGGFAPLAVLFTDTSVNGSAYNWSVTNTTPGNNTAIWFSQVQNPTITLNVGNWNFALNVSNSGGYNITPDNSWVNVTTAPFTITKVYCSVDASDGFAYRSTPGSFPSMRSGAGTESIYDWSTVTVQLRASSTTDQYNYSSRGLEQCNISAYIPSKAIKINSARFRLEGTGKTNGLGTTSIGITRYTPYYPGTSLSALDYAAFWSSPLSNEIAYNDWVTGDNYFTFTPAGIANISRTTFTGIMTRLGWDTLNNQTGLTWSNGATTSFSYYENSAGTTHVPDLEINWSPSTPESDFIISRGAVGQFPTTTQFNDTSVPAPDSWAWTYKKSDGVWTAFSSLKNPKFSFPEGVYDINLTTTNELGSNSIIKTSAVTITAGRDPGDHPYLFFHNISEVPGYQNNGTAPWSTHQASIISTANTALAANPYNYAITQSTGAYYAQYLALAYQITKNPAYGNRATEWLTTMRDRASPDASWDSHFRYAVAFDWVANQSAVTLMSPANYTKCRDNIAYYTDKVYYGSLLESPTDLGLADRTMNGAAAVGIMADAVYGYSNTSSFTTDWNVWKEVIPNRSFVHDPIKTFAPNGFLWLPVNSSSGFDTLGTYKYYFMGSYGSQVDGILPFWMNEWSYFNNQSVLEAYPGLKNVVMAEVYSKLPNRFDNSWSVDGLSNHLYSPAIYRLLDEPNRSYTRWQFAEAAKEKVLFPDVGDGNYLRDWEYYLTVGNYTTEPKYPPTQTKFVTPGLFGVMRDGWTNKSQWLSLYATDIGSTSERDTNQQDQLSFYYEAMGVTLLPDGGEVKETGDAGLMPYGRASSMHNIVRIENPRTSFDRMLDIYGGQTSKGAKKGNAYGNLVTPAYWGTPINTQNVSYMQAHMNFSAVESTSDGGVDQTNLGSTISWNRAVLFPLNDYPILIDRLTDTSNVTWIYKTTFRFGSYSINKSWTPSANAGYLVYASGHAPTIGHVNGEMSIGGVAYDWGNQSGGIMNDTLSGEYPTTATSASPGNSVVWKTTNPYGQIVYLNVFSAPAANITSSNYVSRIGGYTYEDEVKTPNVYFHSPEVVSEYRVTALLPNYSTEQSRTPSELSVTGTGSAIKVIAANGSFTDYIYTGIGNNTFNTFTTDADTVFIRKNTTGGASSYFLVNGTYFTDHGVTIFTNATRQTSTDLVSYGTSSSVIPVASFTGDRSVVRVPGTIMFNDTSTGIPTSWDWGFGDGQANVTAQNVTHKYIRRGYLNVCLTATNTAGNGTHCETIRAIGF